MRRAILITLIIVAALAFIVWGVSKYVQPILPSTVNTDLVLFFAILAVVLAVIDNFTGIIERFFHWGEDKHKPIVLDERQKQRNRETMLKLVWNTWIEGVLHQSLYHEMRIELGMEIHPEYLEHPWDMVMVSIAE